MKMLKKKLLLCLHWEDIKPPTCGLNLLPDWSVQLNFQILYGCVLWFCLSSIMMVHVLPRDIWRRVSCGRRQPVLLVGAWRKSQNVCGFTADVLHELTRCKVRGIDSGCAKEHRWLNRTWWICTRCSVGTKSCSHMDPFRTLPAPRSKRR